MGIEAFATYGRNNEGSFSIVSRNTQTRSQSAARKVISMGQIAGQADETNKAAPE